MPDGDDGLLCGWTVDGAAAQTARAGLAPAIATVPGVHAFPARRHAGTGMAGRPARGDATHSAARAGMEMVVCEDDLASSPTGRSPPA